jgi:hypothetical protein
MGKDRKGHKRNKCTSENKESKSWVFELLFSTAQQAATGVEIYGIIQAMKKTVCEAAKIIANKCTTGV